MSKTIGLILAIQDKCSPQLSKIAERLNLTEQEAKKLHNQVNKLANKMSTGLKNAAKTAGVALGAMAGASAMLINKTVEAGDRIDKMSQKMQMSRKTFQELDYVFSQSGANIELMSKGMVKLSKNISDADKGVGVGAKLFEQLGISVKDSNGQLRKSEDVMFDVISALQKMPDDANRSAIATQLLGKSASELEPMLNKGAKGVEKLRQEFKDLGLGMSDKTIDAAVKFKDTMDKIGRSFSAVGFELAGGLLPSIQQVADSVIKNLPKIKETVTPFIEAMLNGIRLVAEHLDVIVPLVGVVAGAFVSLNVISKVTTLIGFFTQAISVCSAAGGVLNAVLLANPIGLVVAGVGAAVAAFVVAYNKVEWFRKGVQATWSVIKLFFSTLVLGAKLVWEKIEPFVKFGQTIMSWVTPIGLVIRSLQALFSLLGKSGGVFDKVKSWAGKTQVEVDAKLKAPAKVPKHALGTMSAPGGLSLVGENGPELVNLPQGSRVYNNSETKNMMSKDIVINLNIGGNVVGNDDFIAQISNVLGRQLQTALAV